MVQAININFHQTFKPEKQYISAIVEIAADGAKSFSVKDISSLTGIPNGQCSGKVEPHIYYANYMGLINFEKKDGNYCLSRTMLGESVCIEDLGLQESLTILICHCMMLRAVSGAPLWAKIFKTILGILLVIISLLIIYVCYILINKSTFKTSSGDHNDCPEYQHEGHQHGHRRQKSGHLWQRLYRGYSVRQTIPHITGQRLSGEPGADGGSVWSCHKIR